MSREPACADRPLARSVRRRIRTRDGAWRATVACALASAALPGCSALPGLRPGVPVLLYHEIAIDGKAPGETVISRDRFAEQMQYLADHGYHPISVRELVGFMRDGTRLPPRPVVLTFDDGWRSVLQALPVLDRYGFKASFWIIPGAKGIGGDYLDWEEIGRLARHPGFEVESHTLSHPWDPADNLVTWVEGRVADRGLEDARRELVESKRVLEQRLERPVAYLAWPCGWYDDALVALAREAGYQALLTTEDGLNHRGDDPLYTKRAFVDGTCELAAFARILRDGRSPVCRGAHRTPAGHTPAAA